MSKTLKASEMDKLIRAQGRKPKGLKPDKARLVAWLYNKEELNAWRAANESAALPPPPVLTSPGQLLIDGFL